MAVKLTFDAGEFFDSYLEKIEELGGQKLMREAVESGLRAGKSAVNNEMKAVLTNKSNMPAGGKYSTGETQRSIDTDFKVEWNGMVAGIGVGLSWEKLGVKGQVLIFGIPTQRPVKGLKQAIYGIRARRHVEKEVQKAIDKLIERVMKK